MVRRVNSSSPLEGLRKARGRGPFSCVRSRHARRTVRRRNRDVRSRAKAAAAGAAALRHLGPRRLASIPRLRRPAARGPVSRRSAEPQPRRQRNRDELAGFRRRRARVSAGSGPTGVTNAVAVTAVPSSAATTTLSDEAHVVPLFGVEGFGDRDELCSGEIAADGDDELIRDRPDEARVGSLERARPDGQCFRVVDEALAGRERIAPVRQRALRSRCKVCQRLRPLWSRRTSEKRSPGPRRGGLGGRIRQRRARSIRL
jgi:hypothetical protein